MVLRTAAPRVLADAPSRSAGGGGAAHPAERVASGARPRIGPAIEAERVRARAGDRVLAVLLRPVLGAVLHRFLARQARPSHDERAMTIGPNPIRVLVIGAGLAVGYGSGGETATLPQQLSARLAVELGRGVIVETRAQASLRLDRTVELVGMAGAATFDVVVWAPTLEETFRGGTARWTRRLTDIVDHLRRTGRRNVRVVLMGVPRAEGDHVLQRTGAVLADAVNARIEQVASRSERTEYLPVPSKRIDSIDTPLFDPEYRAEVAEALIALLVARRDQSTDAVRGTLAPTLDHGPWSGGDRRAHD